MTKERESSLEEKPETHFVERHMKNLINDSPANLIETYFRFRLKPKEKKKKGKAFSLITKFSLKCFVSFRYNLNGLSFRGSEKKTLINKCVIKNY